MSPREEEFLQYVLPLLRSAEVNAMKRWRHHFSITCYEHCLFVSWVAFLLARHWGWDAKAAARAGLLHDLYLYDPMDRSAHPGNQCLDHPEFALRNAKALCPDLTEREQNAIVSHMFPLAVHLPHSRTAVAVNLADKICTILEVAHLNHTHLARRNLPAFSSRDEPR